MSIAIAALAGALIALAAHDLAAQALGDHPLRPLTGTCPDCGSTRGWTTLTCTKCGRPIRRELVTVLLVAAVAVGFQAALGVSWSLVPYAGFLLLTTALALTDIDSMRIVDRLNIRGSALMIVLLGLTSLGDGDIADFWRALAGGGAYFGGALALFLLVRGNGFGAGDVKLAPLLGVFTTYLGWVTLARSVFAMAIIGGILAVGALLFSEAKRDTELPYGPAMIIGAWLGIISAGISAF